MSSAEKYPKDFFAPNVKLLKFGGMWVPNKSNSIPIYVLYIIYNTFYVIYCEIYHSPAEIFMLQYTMGNISKAVEHLGMITTHLLGTYKLYNWFTFRDRYINIMDTLNKPEFQYTAVGESFKPEAHTTKQMAFSSMLSYCFFVLGNGVPASKTLPVLLQLGSADAGLFLNGTLTCDDFMPYFSYIPFSRTTKGLCIGAIVFQSIPVTIYAWQIVAHDSLFVAMLNYMAVHFENLKGAFCTLRQCCLEKRNIKQIDVLHDEDVPFLESEMCSELRKYTIHIQTMLIIAEEMEFLFTYITLGQVMITLSVFVSRMFLLNTVDIFSDTFAAEIEYLLAVAFQCGMYCIFGSLITFKCSDLSDAMFSSDWLSASPRFKKSILMNMLRLKKPLYLTVGKFTPLTLQTLIGIIKGSYSYYAVLNSQNS